MSKIVSFTLDGFGTSEDDAIKNLREKAEKLKEACEKDKLQVLYMDFFPSIRVGKRGDNYKGGWQASLDIGIEKPREKTYSYIYGLVNSIYPTKFTVRTQRMP